MEKAVWWLAGLTEAISMQAWKVVGLERTSWWLWLLASGFFRSSTDWAILVIRSILTLVVRIGWWLFRDAVSYFVGFGAFVNI